MLKEDNLSENVNGTVIQEEKESWLIEIINDLPRSYMDTKYINPDITYFENSIIVDKSEIDINNIKQYRLKDGKLVICDILKQELMDKLKSDKIKSITKELTRLKVEYSEKEFIFKGKYKQKNRELDKNNLNNVVTSMMVTKKISFSDWKFKDLQDNDVYTTLTMQDILEMFTIMTAQTTKAMHIETDIINKINTMSVEELNNFNVKEEYERLWNS